MPGRLAELELPEAHDLVQPLMFSLWDLEVLPWQSTKSIELLREYPEIEAAVLLLGALAEVVEPPTVDHGREVDEVPVGAVEQRQHLVDGELLTGEGQTDRCLLRREKPEVVGQVDLCACWSVADDEAGKATGCPGRRHLQPVRAKGVLERSEQKRHLLGSPGEVVEVARRAVDLTASDGGTAASQHEVPCFGELDEDGGDAVL